MYIIEACIADPIYLRYIQTSSTGNSGRETCRCFLFFRKSTVKTANYADNFANYAPIPTAPCETWYNRAVDKYTPAVTQDKLIINTGRKK